MQRHMTSQLFHFQNFGFKWKTLEKGNHKKLNIHLRYELNTEMRVGKVTLWLNML